MKNASIILSLIFLVACFVACQPNQTPTPAAPLPTLEGMSLNDGARWKANKETTDGVKTLHRIVESAIAETEPTDKKQSVDSLKQAYQTIFEKCTMEGAAHEQLHTYLLPIGPQLAALNKTEGAEHRAVLTSLDERLRAYDRYFE